MNKPNKRTHLLAAITNCMVALTTTGRTETSGFRSHHKILRDRLEDMPRMMTVLVPMMARNAQIKISAILACEEKFLG